jgi:hypothetical protein
MARIQKLKDYKINEEFDWSGVLGSVFPMLGHAFQDTIKTKISAALMEKIGLSEGSLLSAFVQEFVAEIPVGDYPSILSGNNMNGDYWAPKLSDFARRFVERKGIDTIAEKMGIKPNGLASTYFRNLLLSKEGQDKLTSMFAQILGSAQIGKEALSNLSSSDKTKLSDVLSQRMGQTYRNTGNTSGTSTSTSSSDSDDKGVWGFLKHFMGSAENPNA